ncbi:GntR family transcriptional regulator [Acuticoccus sp. M5D2P5]|uniref:GntR family transcriptional regulator n=1 Tax=Acuticoccus kalidii TaxID=2910977 RepID=UPI001F2BC585|nr:GntR family transcriptional regulator [Acuticoccus kalidii]MCF3934931.1 GntR family transcriptional regulator [Acuticoccus kalidii]
MNKIQRVAAPVREQVERHLRTAIETGDLPPGARLIERELCESLGVSRPLVREALRRLESDGLAVSLPVGGMCVTRLSFADALEIYAVRKELEGLAAAEFALRASEEDRARLGAIVGELHAALEAGDGGPLIDAKNEFYALLARGAGNRFLAEILSKMHGRIRLLRGTSLSAPGRTAHMVAELAAIAEAVLKRDPVRARALAEEHILNAMTATRASLAMDEAG